jgi:hypothetical protein
LYRQIKALSRFDAAGARHRQVEGKDLGLMAQKRQTAVSRETTEAVFLVLQ